MSEQHQILRRSEASAVRIEITDWAGAEAQVMPVRIAVFVVEQGVPEDIERDDFDAGSRPAIARDAGGAGLADRGGRGGPGSARAGRAGPAPGGRGPTGAPRQL